ncbi:MAG: hypothetical protein HY458_02185 [Parcubacteria group bacterium]|nr:hypothetical protein [Parcubacteria group bacterium]
MAKPRKEAELTGREIYAILYISWQQSGSCRINGEDLRAFQKNREEAYFNRKNRHHREGPDGEEIAVIGNVFKTIFWPLRKPLDFLILDILRESVPLLRRRRERDHLPQK